MKSCLLILCVVGCVGTSGDSSDEQNAGVTQYIDISDFNNSALQGAWVDLGGQLAGEFAAVCGDTFCEGDYANLTPLTFNCSVTTKLGTVHDCAWTFAGSNYAVDPMTAVVTTDVPTFECHVHPKTTAAKLITLLQGSSNALMEPLPGMTGSIYDALGDCFQHPIGATPVPYTDDPTPTYVSASDYYVSAAGRASWANSKTALLNGFNNICGDTFCGSDFGDLQSLDFVCAVTKSTGHIKSCQWLFGGSFSGADPSGALDETSKSFRCPVPVSGTLSALITTLTAPGDPIQTPLPGVTTSAYDSLGGCLP